MATKLTFALLVCSAFAASVRGDGGFYGPLHHAYPPHAFAYQTAQPLVYPGYHGGYGHLAPGVATQHHSQDSHGNYEYGYAEPNSQKHEAGNAYTGVSGSYSYNDGHGVNRRIDYVADGYGFRPTFTSTTPTGHHAYRKKRSTLGYPGAIGHGYGAAMAHPFAPYVASQHHSQDEYGNYEYGYAEPNSQKHEAGNAYAGVRGSYSYNDGHGVNRRIDYVADGYGFRPTFTSTTPTGYHASYYH